MFVEFFYYMRSRGLKISLTEWMTVMEAMSKGLVGASLHRFYRLCRSLCIKNEAYFDLYDQCFAEYFDGIEPGESLLDEVMEWLENPKFPRDLTDEEKAQIARFEQDEMREMFEQRLREQKERHDGGNRWVGTGGTSPFGHSGHHPDGIRVGGEGGGRSAAQIASDRRFRNLRNDLILDTRQISVALRQLRKFGREGRRDELDLEGTIDATAKNAGDIELLFQPERKNTVKLLLLMDVGGSMTPYTRLSEQLFSAAHKATHFKAFKHFYFHNCPYESLYLNMARRERIPTKKVLQDYDESWFCVIVGDAAMSPYELTSTGGAIDFFHHNDETGLVWMQRIADRFPRTVWLNPDPPHYWNYTVSTRMIREIFSMFPLTLAGLEEAIAELRQGKPRSPVPSLLSA